MTSNDPERTSAVLAYLARSPDLAVAEADIAAMEELPGDHNALWWIRTTQRDIVLKMFLDAGQARGRRQFTNQASAAQCGIAPRALTFDRYPDGLSHQIMLYEWCPGTPLDPARAEDRAALAVALATAHARRPEEQTRLSPHPVNPHYQWSLIQGSRRLVEEGVARGGASPLSDMVLEALARAQARVQPELDRHELTPPVLVHGDLQLDHCLKVDGRVQLLDWEMGGLGDPAREICHIFLHLLPNLTPGERSDWLGLYADHAAVLDLGPRVDTYAVLLPVASLLELVLMPSAAQDAQAAAEECQLLQLAFGLCLDHVTAALDMHLDLSEKQALQAAYRILRQDLYTQHETKEFAS